MTHRFHNGCLTDKLIRIAKMSPKQASSLCSIAHAHLSPLQIASLPLPAVMSKFGAEAAAQIDMKNAASDFQDNNQNSKDPSDSGVPDKKYPISQYATKQDCINDLVQNLSIDSQAAERECSNQFGPGSGTKGGNWYTSAAPKGNPVPVTVHSGSGNRIAVMNASSNRINQETRDYYSQKGKAMNASVTNSNEVPSWIVATNGNTNHLVNTTSNTHLRGASLDKHIEYMQAIHEPIAETLSNRAERRNNQARIRNAKKEEVDNRPAWAICANL